MGQHNHFGCVCAYACMGMPMNVYVHACVHVCACSMGVCACMVCASVVRMPLHGLPSALCNCSLTLAWHAPMPFKLCCDAAGQHARCTLLARCWHNMQACMPEACMVIMHGTGPSQP